jgi:biopolymer transport protein ExbD
MRRRSRKHLEPPKVGLRTKWAPKSRVGHGLVSAAPWCDFVLVVICVMMLDGQLVRQPGIVIDLPEVAFRDGRHSDMVAVVRVVPGGKDEPSKEVVFFDDESFRIGEPSENERLQRLLIERVAAKPERTLVIHADRAVRHGTLSDVLDMARSAGVSEVNMATRDPSAALPEGYEVEKKE